MKVYSKFSMWPSAATCAFLAGGQAILWAVIFQWQRSFVRSASRKGDLASLYEMLIVGTILMFTLVFGVAVQAMALLGVGRLQRSVAPVSSQLGQWAVGTYVTAMGITLVSAPLTNAGLFNTNRWLLEVPTVAITLAFGCSAWATRGASGVRQRWAHLGMVALTALGIFDVVQSAGQYWHLLGPLHSLASHLAGWDAALRAATWFAVGAWLNELRR